MEINIIIGWLIIMDNHWERSEWDEDPKDDGDYADPEVEGVEEYEDE